VQVVLADPYTHPCESVEQVSRTLALAHTLPVVVQGGMTLHVQAAEPAVPVHV
jgi:hypothetical protein